MSASRTFKDAAYGHLASVGKALSSPARLEILELLAQAPRTVEVLAGDVGQSVANTSHHLQVLRKARLVSRTARGTSRVYALAGPEVPGLLVQLQAVAAAHVAELQALTDRWFADRDGLEPVDAATLLDRLRDDTVVLVDVRPVHEFAAGHLPGALSIPVDQLEDHLDQLPEGIPIVAYCRGPFCTFSATAAKRLRELGFEARRTDATVHSLAAVQAAP